jgi:glycosyltransferase involved in cell wall biosynthesis
MRVLVNYFCALKQRSGVGHYTAELVAAIQNHFPEVELDLFPPRQTGALIKAAMQWIKPAPLSTGAENTKSFGWKQKLKENIKAGGRNALGYLFADRCRRNAYDLHHEPNFLPFRVDAPTVATVHDLSVFENPDWHPADRVSEFESRFARALKSCVHFFADTEYVRQEMISKLGVSSEKITATPLGVREGMVPLCPLEVKLQLREMKLPEKYLLHVGTIEPRKNLLFLMKEYCSLPASIREKFPLLLVGGRGWNAAPIMHYFENEARHKGVRLAGYVPDEKLAVLYNGARGLVTASHYEGFGLPVIEMMACGGAVLASDIGAHREITHGKGFLVNNQAKGAWREAMMRLALEDDWCRLLRKNTAEITSIYSWKHCANSVVGGYQKALNIHHKDETRLPWKKAG